MPRFLLHWSLLVTLVMLLLSGLALAVAPGLPSAGVIAFQRDEADGAGALRVTLHLLDVARGLVQPGFSYTSQQINPFRWSPDGEYLLVISSAANGLHTTHLYDRDGTYHGAITPPASDGGRGHGARWSGHGEAVLFLAVSAEQRRLYRRTVTDATAQHLPTRVPVTSAPSSSPDGTAVVFSSRQPSGENIYRLNLTDGVLTQLTDEPAGNREPLWSPAGDRIAFLTLVTPGETHISIIDLSTGQRRDVLTPVNLRAITGLTWSPDGTRLLFTGSARSGGMYEPAQVHLLDALTGDVTRLTARTINLEPAWSPDGMQIVFTRRQTRHSPQPELIVMDIATGNERRIAWDGIQAQWRR